MWCCSCIIQTEFAICAFMMIKTTPLLFSLSLLFAGSAALADTKSRTSDTLTPFQMAQSGCGSAASQAEAQTGGSVIGAPRLVNQGGRAVCVVTVLIKDPNGKKPPSRKNVTIPAN